jgi:hypothetical protein
MQHLLHQHQHQHQHHKGQSQHGQQQLQPNIMQPYQMLG